MSPSRTIVCVHAKDCDCPSCLREYGDWMEAIRAIEHMSDRDFADWVESPDATIAELGNMSTEETP